MRAFEQRSREDLLTQWSQRRIYNPREFGIPLPIAKTYAYLCRVRSSYNLTELVDAISDGADLRGVWARLIVQLCQLLSNRSLGDPYFPPISYYTYWLSADFTAGIFLRELATPLPGKAWDSALGNLSRRNRPDHSAFRSAMKWGANLSYTREHYAAASEPEAHVENSIKGWVRLMRPAACHSQLMDLLLAQIRAVPERQQPYEPGCRALKLRKRGS
jgi:hypothetical protein